jgi:hypothetical protein
LINMAPRRSCHPRRPFPIRRTGESHAASRREYKSRGPQKSTGLRILAPLIGKSREGNKGEIRIRGSGKRTRETAKKNAASVRSQVSFLPRPPRRCAAARTRRRRRRLAGHFPAFSTSPSPPPVPPVRCAHHGTASAPTHTSVREHHAFFRVFVFVKRVYK